MSVVDPSLVVLQLMRRAAAAALARKLPRLRPASIAFGLASAILAVVALAPATPRSSTTCPSTTMAPTTRFRNSSLHRIQTTEGGKAIRLSLLLVSEK